MKKTICTNDGLHHLLFQGEEYAGGILRAPSIPTRYGRCTNCSGCEFVRGMYGREICQPSGSVSNGCIPGRMLRGWHKIPWRMLSGMAQK